MGNSILLGLLQNTAILLSFAMLYENIWMKNEASKSSGFKILTGIIIGGISVILMLTPWTLVPGITFDTRSILLSVSGLFFGPIPTIVAMLISGMVRLYMGGDGLWMGLAVIFSSGSIGLMWRKFRPFESNNYYYSDLLILGLIVHIVMSTCTLLLPHEKTFLTFKIIIFPLLLLYTPATMLLGLLMVKQSRNWQNRMVKLKLLESERRLNQILESGNIVSLLLDKDGNITFCNHYFLYITGYSGNEIIGKNWFELFIPAELRDSLFQIFIKGIQQDNMIKNYDNQIVTKNGEKLFISWYNISLQSGIDEMQGMASIGVNITDSKMYENRLEEKNAEIEFQNLEYKKLNEELVLAKERAEESNLLKTAFLNNISHEIRTPFNGLLGFLSVIQNEELTKSERDKYIGIINKSAERLLNTINDIVEISQIQAGQLKLKVSKFNISCLYGELISRYKMMAEAKDLNLILINNLPDNKFNIITDCQKLNDVLSCLINNAIKFSFQGSIECGISHKNDTLEFFVKDTGVGIPENKHHTVFERFMQADVSNTRNFEGSGLGLSIAKAYVEMLGGRIWLESKEGEGSVFYFTIPHIASANEKRNLGTEISVHGTNKQLHTEKTGLKILIVEDNEIAEIFIALSMETFGKEIVKVSTGQQAIDICKKNADFDLVLMNLQMPEMNGYEATRKIREFNDHVVIIAHSFSEDSGDRRNALDAGCNDYITKPFNLSSLKGLMKKHF